MSIRRKILPFLFNISPKLSVQVKFLTLYPHYRKFLSFKNPISLDEKIQWLKFNTYNNNSLVTLCADKYRVREYLNHLGLEEILNELYGMFDQPEEIDWEKLPQKFVIKWNFGQGHNFFCADKTTLQIPETMQLLKDWRKTHSRFHKQYSELHYRDIQPKLICEKYIETEDGALPVDYKVYCFNGVAHFVLVCTNRASGKPSFYFVDKDWELQRLNKSGKEAPEGFQVPKPEGYQQLFEYASRLAKPFPFVRVDLYLEKGKVIFGELTFTPAGGFDPNRLYDTDLLFGSMVDLDYGKNCRSLEDVEKT
jgi:hypothetical protein